MRAEAAAAPAAGGRFPLARVIAWWRLGSGLVLATFITLHLSNHALGVISIDLQEAMREWISPLWHSVPGTVLLYGAWLTHPALGLYALWRRQTLRMPRWEAAQLLLGLSIPLLLIPHVFGTRIAGSMLGHETTYVAVITGLWSSATSLVRQPLLVVVAWLHLLVGLHYWLRVRPAYRRNFPALVPLALLVPALALLGFYGAAAELRDKGDLPPAGTRAPAAAAPVDPDDAAKRERIDRWRGDAYLAYLAIVASVLAARLGRDRWARRGGVYRIFHANGRQIVAPVGQSVLDALRAAGVPHASVCGGRARCTTCRIRVGREAALPAPGALETQALSRIHAAPDVRLACQLRPVRDIRITPLLPPHVGAADANQGGMPGREHRVAVMFVDIRESSRLGEQRLPYDVFFILNRFFAEMSEALRATGGLYSTFNGDGFMALYGTSSDIARGCRDALLGAIAVHDGLRRINAALAADLREPLRAGISLHAGDAIVGTMGPPQQPILSALGDTVNVAARLEAETKVHATPLIVSADCAAASGVDLSGYPLHTVTVRGRATPVSYHVVMDPFALRSLVDAAEKNRPIAATA
jgi:adenylate cyclase